MAYLDNLENDHSIVITLAFASVGGSGVVVHGRGRDRNLLMDPSTIGASGAYDLPSAVMHEVVESSGYARAGVPQGATGYPFHAHGVSAEDASLMGAHMASRTCRSQGGDITRQPRPVVLGCY